MGACRLLLSQPTPRARRSGDTVVIAPPYWGLPLLAGLLLGRNSSAIIAFSPVAGPRPISLRIPLT
jgi:hypothetical protein